MAATQGPIVVIESVSGVLLSPEDARYALEAIEVLLDGRRPTAALSDFIDRLRKTTAKTGVCDDERQKYARKFGNQQDSLHHGVYDLDTGQAAAILGITPNGVRDLARRGVLPSHRAGGRWLYPAAPVVQRAERLAAKRG